MMADKRLVWDLPTRLFHWLLVASILASCLTAEPGSPTMQWHMWLGYWTTGLIVFRLLWGLVGPKHARFSQFIPGPRRLGQYAATLFRRDSKPSIGHNPMGGLAVLVMLLMLAIQAGSGLFISDDIVWAGPWNPAVSGDTANWLGSVHHLNFDILIWVIALHVFTIIFYRVFKRQNLFTPMITGHKPATVVIAGEEISGSELLKALVVAVISAGAVYLMLEMAPPPVVEEYY